MNRNSVVIFPDTIPAAQVLIPLVLVFEPVVYCQPVENDDSGIPGDPFVKSMIERSYCSIHSPAPLIENRERFMNLVNDIHQRRDDYAAQLTHVSLASISTGSQTDSESKSSIVSSLMSGHRLERAEQEQMEKLLWQARLVLKLGEQLDADQNKVVEEMQSMHDRERHLFAGLSGGGSIFQMTENLNSPVADPDRMQRLRLKAWARLYAFGPSKTGNHIFVSSDPDAVDRLSEEYERLFGSRPAELVTVPLPAHHSNQDEYHEQLKQFVQNSQQVLQDPSTVSNEEQDQWKESLERYFPEMAYGRRWLVLYDFSKVKITKLFLDSFGHDEDDLCADLAEEVPQDVVIGLLIPQ